MKKSIILRLTSAILVSIASSHCGLLKSSKSTVPEFSNAIIEEQLSDDINTGVDQTLRVVAGQLLEFKLSDAFVPEGKNVEYVLKDSPEKGTLSHCMNLPDSENPTDTTCMFKVPMDASDLISFTYRVKSEQYFSAGQGQVTFQIIASDTSGGSSKMTIPGLFEGLEDPNTYSVLVANNKYYASTYYKIYKSENEGLKYSGSSPTIVPSASRLVSSGSNIYAATKSGLFVSSDGGTNYAAKTTAQGLGSDSVNSVAANGLNVYAATSGGLSISRDGGITFNNFTQIGFGEFQIRDIAVYGTSVYAATDRGLAVSNDSGISFINLGNTRGFEDFNILKVSAFGNTIAAATLDRNLYISTNGGQSFSKANVSKGSVYQVLVTSTHIYSVTLNSVLSSNNGGVSFTDLSALHGMTWTSSISVEGSKIIVGTTYLGAWISTDNGLTFTKKDYKVITDIAVENLNVIVASRIGLFISQDGGITFNKKTTADGLGSNDIYDIALQGQNVYVASEAGLSISRNGGQSFVSTNAASARVYKVAVSGQYVVTTTSSGEGVYLSTDGGVTFRQKLMPYLIPAIAVDSENIYGVAGWGLIYSAHESASYTNPMNSTVSYNYTSSILAKGSNVYAGGFYSKELNVSTDRGRTFTQKTLPVAGIIDMKSYGSTIYIAGPNGLAITNNDGTSFSLKTQSDGLGSSRVSAIAVNSTTIFAVCDNGLFVSRDGGNSFN